MKYVSIALFHWTTDVVVDPLEVFRLCNRSTASHFFLSSSFFVFFFFFFCVGAGRQQTIRCVGLCSKKTIDCCEFLVNVCVFIYVLVNCHRFFRLERRVG